MFVDVCMIAISKVQEAIPSQNKHSLSASMCLALSALAFCIIEKRDKRARVLLACVVATALWAVPDWRHGLNRVCTAVHPSRKQAALGDAAP